MNATTATMLAVRLAGLLAAALLSACAQQSPEQLIASGRDYLAKRELNAAEIQLKNALQKAPENGEARLLLGQVLLDKGDAAGAENELRRALRLGQDPTAVMPLLARALAELGRHNKLIDEFATFRAADPVQQARLQVLLGDAYLAVRELAPARAAYGAALATLPDDPAARLGQARLLAADGELAQADAAADAILALHPRYARALALKADLAAARGERDRALRLLEQAVDADPAFRPAQVALLAALIGHQRFDQAAARLEVVRKSARGDPTWTYFGGVIALEKGDLAAARDQALQVLKLAPDHVPTLVLAGGVELRSNNPAQAESHLRRALALQPDHAMAQRLLVATHLRAGQPQRAMDALQVVMKGASADDPGVLQLAGEVHLARGDLKQAAAYYEAAAALAPTAAVRARYGQIALAGGNAELGFRELEAASALEPALIQADVARAVAHLQRGEFERALAAAQDLERKQPDDPLGRHLVGVVHSARKDDAAARAAFERALALRPNYLPSIQALATLDAGENKAGEGRRRFEALIEREPANDQAILALADFQARTGAAAAEVLATVQRAVSANPKSASARIALVNLHLRGRDVQAAVDAARQAAQALPDDVRVLEALAQAQERAGQGQQAAETLNRIVALQPDAVRPLRQLAAFHARQKDPDRAAGALRRAQRLAPTDREIARDLVAVLAANGRYRDALNEVAALKARAPEYGGVHLLEGDVLAAQKRWPEAEQAYREGLKREPTSGLLAARTHATLLSADRKAEADRFARDWLQRHPKETAFRMYLADRALAGNDFAAAARLYEAVIAAEPRNAVALNNLAWIGGRTGDARAIEFAQRAVALAPGNAAFLDTLGMLLLGKGDTTRGLDLVTRARQLAPERLDIRLNYAKALIQAGRRDEARQELEALRAIERDFPGKQEIPALLKTV